MPLLRLIIADVALQVFTVYTKYSGRNVGSVSDDSFESMAGIEQAFKDLDIKWTFCVYVLNAMMTRTCPEVRGLGTDISLSNPLHGTMFWYIARDFVCYGIRNAGFLVPDLKDSVGPDGGVSSLQALEDLATSRMAELKIVCERLHQDVPDFNRLISLLNGLVLSMFQQCSSNCCGFAVVLVCDAYRSQTIAEIIAENRRSITRRSRVGSDRSHCTLPDGRMMRVERSS